MVVHAHTSQVPGGAHLASSLNLSRQTVLAGAGRALLHMVPAPASRDNRKRTRAKRGRAADHITMKRKRLPAPWLSGRGFPHGQAKNGTGADAGAVCTHRHPPPCNRRAAPDFAEAEVQPGCWLARWASGSTRGQRVDHGSHHRGPPAKSFSSTQLPRKAGGRRREALPHTTSCTQSAALLPWVEHRLHAAHKDDDRLFHSNLTLQSVTVSHSTSAVPSPQVPSRPPAFNNPDRPPPRQARPGAAGVRAGGLRRAPSDAGALCGYCPPPTHR